MTVGAQQVPLITLALGAAALLWLLTLLAGIISWEKSRKGRFRTTDILVLVTSVLLAGAWMLVLMPKTAAAPVAPVTAQRSIGTCAVIMPGDSEAKVKAKLGDPDEIRGEEETRGPASNVWIYRQSRCAIHFLGDRVESIE
ncbi:MAG TPA: hypothetical protein VNA04_18155 [Thermoanaerobaculia bacterium]|nr:hypothetical protein [Thermoanaerobaculia bacterium]